MEDRPADAEFQARVRPWREVFAVAHVPMAVATWFGAGFLPFAPGTWGSLAAIPVVHLLGVWQGPGAVLGFAIAISLIGVHASGVTARLRGVEDPSEVVVDEVAGQAIALLPVYSLLAPDAPWRVRGPAILAAFLLFRILDVVKPGPVRRLERLPGGYGIMADDILGGGIAGVLVALGLLIWLRG